METSPEDSAMRQTYRAVGLVGVALCLGASAYDGFALGGSVLIGAAVATLNLYVLSRSVHNMIAGQRASWGMMAAVKFVVLLAVVYGLIQSGLVSAIGLGLGFAALPVGILLAGLFGAPAPQQRDNGSKRALS